MVNPHVLPFLKQPIAHRGLYSPTRPENTLAALEPAIAERIPVEIDIGLTKDNKWMLGHWPLYRNSLNELKLFHKSTALEMQQAWPEASKRHIPSLSQAMELLQGKVPLLLDVKLYSLKKTQGLRRLQKLINAYQEKYGGSVAVQSFNPTVLTFFDAKNMETPRGLVVGSLGNIPSRIIPTGKLPSKAALHYTQPDFLTVNSLNSPSYFNFLRNEAKIPLIGYNIRSEEAARRIYPLVDNTISDPSPKNQPYHSTPMILKMFNSI